MNFDVHADAVTEQLDGLDLRQQLAVLVGVLIATILNAPETDTLREQAVAEVVRVIPQHFEQAKALFRGTMH